MGRQLARQLGVHHEALRNWIRQVEADADERTDRLSTPERECAGSARGGGGLDADLGNAEEARRWICPPGPEHKSKTREKSAVIMGGASLWGQTAGRVIFWSSSPAGRRSGVTGAGRHARWLRPARSAG
jgi:hypothetical protein